MQMLREQLKKNPSFFQDRSIKSTQTGTMWTIDCDQVSHFPQDSDLDKKSQENVKKAHKTRIQPSGTGFQNLTTQIDPINKELCSSPKHKSINSIGKPMFPNYVDSDVSSHIMEAEAFFSMRPKSVLEHSSFQQTETIQPDRDNCVLAESNQSHNAFVGLSGVRKMCQTGKHRREASSESIPEEIPCIPSSPFAEKTFWANNENQVAEEVEEEIIDCEQTNGALQEPWTNAIDDCIAEQVDEECDHEEREDRDCLEENDSDHLRWSQRVEWMPHNVSETIQEVSHESSEELWDLRMDHEPSHSIDGLDLSLSLSQKQLLAGLKRSNIPKPSSHIGKKTVANSPKAQNITGSEEKTKVALQPVPELFSRNIPTLSTMEKPQIKAMTPLNRNHKIGPQFHETMIHQDTDSHFAFRNVRSEFQSRYSNNTTGTTQQQSGKAQLAPAFHANWEIRSVSTTDTHGTYASRAQTSRKRSVSQPRSRLSSPTSTISSTDGEKPRWNKGRESLNSQQRRLVFERRKEYEKRQRELTKREQQKVKSKKSSNRQNGDFCQEIHDKSAVIPTNNINISAQVAEVCFCKKRKQKDYNNDVNSAFVVVYVL